MKRTWRAILALTLVCAVALTAAAMALGSKALPLTMTDACTIGDPAAAEGLHMATRIGMEQNRLQWRMDYDPAADTTDASFRLAYSDRSGQWIFDGYGYNIQCLLVRRRRLLRCLRPVGHWRYRTLPGPEHPGERVRRPHRGAGPQRRRQL